MDSKNPSLLIFFLKTAVFQFFDNKLSAFSFLYNKINMVSVTFVV